MTKFCEAMNQFYETKNVKVVLSHAMLIEMLQAYDEKLESVQVGEALDFYVMADEHGNTMTFLIDQDADMHKAIKKQIG